MKCLSSSSLERSKTANKSFKRTGKTPPVNSALCANKYRKAIFVTTGNNF